MLDDNDAYGLFAALGDLVVTGPTLTNVNDFRAILIERTSDDERGSRMSALPTIGLRGKISAARFEISTRRLQIFADMAVSDLQFRLLGASGEATRWNCTEVYARAGAWKIVQTHWSFAGGRGG